MNELVGGLLDEGGGEGEGSGASDSGSSVPEFFVGELTAEDVLERLNSSKEIPNHLRSLETRAFGKLGALEESLRGMQKSVPTSVKFDESRLAEIAKYDPNLAAAVAKDLGEAIQVNPLDETSLAPHLDKMRSEVLEQVKNYFVGALNLDLDEFVPEDWKNPGDGRQRDYVDWFAQQTYETQRALSERDPVGTARAMRSFRDWETKKTEERKKVAEAKAKKLEGGLQPTGTKQQAKSEQLQTEEAAFLSVFKE